MHVIHPANEGHCRTGIDSVKFELKQDVMNEL
ncbi:hypothetical protein SAMN04488505_102196 [Chitinophaga rupis]|uniref:Uncharacterized protein n=1 Tax=Chitinophaga rupis TaxID=573321 RepID=A0A1H7PYW6_9BACT|nr:hypothetical protein SAMN04488505_102196 [Chitinophaga rupis]